MKSKLLIMIVLLVSVNLVAQEGTDKDDINDWDLYRYSVVDVNILKSVLLNPKYTEKLSENIFLKNHFKSWQKEILTELTADILQNLIVSLPECNQFTSELNMIKDTIKSFREKIDFLDDIKKSLNNHKESLDSLKVQLCTYNNKLSKMNNLKNEKPQNSTEKDKNNTAQKEDHESSQQENNGLISKIEKLIKNKGALMHTIDSLIKESDSIVVPTDPRILSKDTVILNKDILMLKKDTQKLEIDSLINNRITLIEEIDSLIKTSNLIVVKKDTVTLIPYKDTLILKRDTLILKRDTLILKIDDLSKHKVKLTEVKFNNLKQSENVHAIYEHLVLKNNTLIFNIDDIIKRKVKLMREIDSQINQYESIIVKNDTLILKDDTIIFKNNSLILKDETLKLINCDILVLKNDTIILNKDTLTKQNNYLLWEIVNHIMKSDIDDQHIKSNTFMESIYGLIMQNNKLITSINSLFNQNCTINLLIKQDSILLVTIDSLISIYNWNLGKQIINLQNETQKLNSQLINNVVSNGYTKSNDSKYIEDMQIVLAMYLEFINEIINNKLKYNPTSEKNKPSLTVFEIVRSNSKSYSRFQKGEQLQQQYNTWQAAVINGTANFLAGRFKDEIVEMFIKQIFNRITREPKHKEQIKLVFPQTSRIIDNIYTQKDNIFSYEYEFELIRNSLQIDLQQLPENIVDNIAGILPQIKPEQQSKIKLGKRIIDFTQRGLSLDRVISELSTETYYDTTLKQILNALNVITHATLDTTEVGWINPYIDVLPEKLDDPKVRLFYGLLYQKLYLSNEFNNIFKEDNTKSETEIAKDLQNMCGFAYKLNNLNSFQKNKNDSLLKFTNDDYMFFVQQFYDVITTFIDALPEEVLKKEYRDYFKYSQYFISITESIIQGNYYKAVSEFLVLLYDNVDQDNLDIVRTITFLSQISSVSKYEEMEKLLQTYALPRGSSSIKRKSYQNVAINGYVGPSYGVSLYKSNQNRVDWKISDFSLSAPIGLSWSIKLGHQKGSWSVFGSVLDLGTIVGRQIINSEMDSVDIKFENFFSPGLAVIYNVHSYPISIALQGNFIPNYKMKLDNKNEHVFRVSLSILVDIPFFNLYNLPLKKQPPKSKSHVTKFEDDHVIITITRKIKP